MRKKEQSILNGKKERRKKERNQEVEKNKVIRRWTCWKERRQMNGNTKVR